MSNILVKTPLNGNYDTASNTANISANESTVPNSDKAVNKIQKLSSFKSNENIHKREDGSYYVVSANKSSSVTL